MAVINSTSFDGTANNALFLNGSAANGYQTIAGLAANVATLAANNALFLGGNAANTYAPLASPTFTGNTSIAGLSANGSLGTSGQVLTTNGSIAYWNTLNVAAGVNADPRTITSTKTVNFGAGSTSFMGVVSLSSTKTVMVVRDGSKNYYACVYDSSTDTMGSAVTVATGTNNDARFLRISDTAMLVCYGSGTTLVTSIAVLTVSGTTITVGTAATTTLTATYGTTCFLPQDPIAVGSSYILGAYCAQYDSLAAIPFTVSGSTVTIGSPSYFGAMYANSLGFVSYSSTQFYALYADGNQNQYIKGFTVSGTTITGGSAVQLYSNSYGRGFVSVMSNGSHLLISNDNSYNNAAWKVTMSTSTVSASSASLAVGGGGYYPSISVLSGSKALAVGSDGTTVKASVINLSGSVSVTGANTILSPINSSLVPIGSQAYITLANGSIVFCSGYWQATISESAGALVVEYGNKNVVTSKFTANATAVSYGAPTWGYAGSNSLTNKIAGHGYYNNFVVGTSGKYYAFNTPGVCQSYDPTTGKWELYLPSTFTTEKLDPNNSSYTWALDAQSTASTSRTFYGLQYT